MKRGFVEEKSLTKVCKCCGEEKSLSEFYKNENYKDGHLNYCKRCQNEKTRQNVLKKDKAWVLFRFYVPKELNLIFKKTLTKENEKMEDVFIPAIKKYVQEKYLEV